MGVVLTRLSLGLCLSTRLQKPSSSLISLFCSFFSNISDLSVTHHPHPPDEKVAILPILGREWEHAAEGAIMHGYLGVPCLKLDSVCIRIQKA